MTDVELVRAIADRALLRRVLAYARANRWNHVIYGGESDREHVWEPPVRPGTRIEATVRSALLGWRPWGMSSMSENTARVTSVRQAVDLLCALEVLPATFSSAWAAGRDDTITAREKAGRLVDEPEWEYGAAHGTCEHWESWPNREAVEKWLVGEHPLHLIRRSPWHLIRRRAARAGPAEVAPLSDEDRAWIADDQRHVRADDGRGEG